MVFTKYPEAKQLRYFVNTKSFNLFDLPHKLIPTPMFFSYVHPMVNQLDVHVQQKQKYILSSEITV